MYVPQQRRHILPQDETEQLVEVSKRNTRTYPSSITTLQASLRTDILTEAGGGFKEGTWGQHLLEEADAMTGNARTNAYKRLLGYKK